MGFEEYIRKHLPKNLEGVSRLRLGRGVLGNTTYAVVAYLIATAAVTWSLNKTPEWALLAVLVLTTVFVVYLVGSYIFAHLHPDLAMLGDSEWLTYQQQMGAKDKSIIIDQSPVVGGNVISHEPDDDA